MIEGYNILKRVAEGGMAEVFLAEKQGVGGFRKRVILKKLLPKYTEDPAFVEMFYNEAVLVSNLNHPNIVQVFDVIRDNFEIYIAMEYVDGPPLSMIVSRMRQKNMPMPFPVAARIISDVASALDYAYTAKDENGQPMRIIHRDVSPSNIMINKTGLVKLVDFGIAKASFTDDEAFAGYVRGKPAYMAPELFKERKASHQSDIFALGVILFELTTGHKLFKRKDVVRTIKSVLRCRVPPPTNLVPDYPKELEEIIYKSVTPDPSTRYGSAADMARDLDAYISSTNQRLTPSNIFDFVSKVVAGKSDKSFEEMTLDDFVQSDPSLGDTASINRMSEIISESDSYGDTDVGTLLERLSGKPKKTRTRHYVVWLNGFLVALIAFVAVYFLALRPKHTITQHKTKPRPVQIQKLSLRLPNDIAYIRPMERRSLVPFFSMAMNKAQKKEAGTLKLHIHPKARVWLDGDYVGRIKDLSVDIPKGRHIILAKTKGYKSLKKKIRIRSGRTKRLDIALEPVGKGKQAASTAKPSIEKPQKAVQVAAATIAPKPQPTQPKQEPKVTPPPPPPKKVPHLGFVTSPLRETAIILKVLSHDQGRFAGPSTIKTAILYDDDPFSRQKAQAVYSAMKRLAGKSIGGKRISPVMVMVDGPDKTLAGLRAAHARMVYLVPMDRKDVRIAMRAAARAGAATVTGVSGYQHIGVCLSLGRKEGRLLLLIKKSKCTAEGFRFDEKILNLAEVY